MDANAVIMELLDKDIIGRGDENIIAKTDDPTQQNQKLHLMLKDKCTDEALKTVCDLLIAVKGHPKMKALGKDMKRSMETGKCVSSCVQESVWCEYSILSSTIRCFVASNERIFEYSLDRKRLPNIAVFYEVITGSEMRKTDEGSNRCI